MPDYCELRLLVFKWQVGAVMGKRGATINRIRSNSAATIKVIQPERGMPVVPCAVDDDELILVSLTLALLLLGVLCCVLHHSTTVSRAALLRPWHHRTHFAL
jgi:hypothetical protein